MEYLTAEDYEIAERNGICRDYAYQRYYMLGWDREKAINTPVIQYKNLWRNYKDISKVSRSVFYKRIREGISPEEAATTPPHPHPGGWNKFTGKFSEKDLEIAAANGISESTAKARVYIYKWPVELAITVPVGKKRLMMRRAKDIGISGFHKA